MRPPGDRALGRGGVGGLAGCAAAVAAVAAVDAATLAVVRRTRISPRMSSSRDILWLIRWTSLRTSCLSSVNESMMDEESDRDICW
jgi:hypothetical protein